MKPEKIFVPHLLAFIWLGSLAMFLMFMPIATNLPNTIPFKEAKIFAFLMMPLLPLMIMDIFRPYQDKQYIIGIHAIAFFILITTISLILMPPYNTNYDMFGIGFLLTPILVVLGFDVYTIANHIGDSQKKL
jgi:hypothetical protein